MEDEETVIPLCHLFDRKLIGMNLIAAEHSTMHVDCIRSMVKRMLSIWVILLGDRGRSKGIPR